VTEVPGQPSRKGAATGNQVTLNVIARLWTLIENEQFRLGDRLDPERELARKMKVSRSSLRSAIAFLAMVGVLKIKHGTGSFVISKPPMVQLDPTLVGNLRGSASALHEARLVIESRIADLAARRLRSTHAAELADKVMNMYASLDQPQEYYSQELLFHRVVAKAAGNPILLALFEATASGHYESLSRRIPRLPNLRQSAEAHRDIYLALRSHDPLRASRLMERYLKARVEVPQPDTVCIPPPRGDANDQEYLHRA
jgi:GntR family transcriptional regulator, transcriptional repressor for pyruvate dehydrogenase complex